MSVETGQGFAQGPLGPASFSAGGHPQEHVAPTGLKRFRFRAGYKHVAPSALLAPCTGALGLRGSWRGSASKD